MKIKIKSYNAEKNHYEAEIGHVQVQFDPFVSGILNGEEHDLEKIQSLVGREFYLDLFQSTGGAWLLTPEGEKELRSVI